MPDILRPDLCIVGASALGIAMALDARARGADVVLVDGGNEQGDGAQQRLHRLAFAASAARVESIRTSPRLGLESREPKPNFKAIAEHAERVARDMAPRDAQERLAALGIRVLNGEPSFVDRNALVVGDTVLRAKHFVLATGSRPHVPALSGLEQVAFFTPDDILANTRRLTHLVVIGCDATALELAQAYRRLGSAVTLVPHGEILPGFDREAVGLLLRALTDEGIDIAEGAVVTAIVPRSQGTGISMRRADGSDDALDVSHILVSAGRVPDLDPESTAKAKLRPDPALPGQFFVGARGETSNPRIYAIGGVAGIEDPAIAQAQAALVLDRLLGDGGRGLDLSRLVHHVATSPMLAQVGRLGDAKSLRAGEVLLRANLSETEAARADAQPAGLLKVRTANKGRLLGCVMLGSGALETMALLALAMEQGTDLAHLGRVVLPASAPAAALTEFGRQAASKQAPPPLHKLLLALRRLIP